MPCLFRSSSNHIAEENKQFVASSPILDIATQRKTKKQVKENMANLVNDYLNDHQSHQ